MNNMQYRQLGTFSIKPRGSGKTSELVDQFLKYPEESVILVPNNRIREYILNMIRDKGYRLHQSSILVIGDRNNDWERILSGRHQLRVLIDEYFQFSPAARKFFSDKMVNAAKSVDVWGTVNYDNSIQFADIDLVAKIRKNRAAGKPAPEFSLNYEDEIVGYQARSIYILQNSLATHPDMCYKLHTGFDIIELGILKNLRNPHQKSKSNLSAKETALAVLDKIMSSPDLTVEYVSQSLGIPLKDMISFLRSNKYYNAEIYTKLNKWLNSSPVYYSTEDDTYCRFTGSNWMKIVYTIK
jgi:hypothetical protein